MGFIFNKINIVWFNESHYRHGRAVYYIIIILQYTDNNLFPPTDKPSAPRLLEPLDVVAESVTLRWEPALSDGGAPIKHYVVEKRDAARDSWVSAGRVDAGECERIDMVAKHFDDILGFWNDD